ncbi:ATP-binding protein [Marinobacterium jannaschii]|uniref:ATP-binding protein n=1 Tax=Marinobacterium jannaschii TaxID=64970 RepID=UPI000686D81D|nr:ATP-binding protein [Marinobacterium jannaschii]
MDLAHGPHHSENKVQSFRCYSLKAIGTVIAALSALMGLVVMTGWYSKNQLLIQIDPEFVPMQFNTALGFLMSGTGLLAAIYNRRYLMVGLGGMLAALGGLTLAEYLADVDLGIDQLLMEHYITTLTSHPGRMAPNTALCFLLTGMALVSAFLLQRVMFPMILGIITVCLGGLSLTGYLVGFEAIYGWMHFTRMAVHTSVGFVFVGTGVLLWNASRRLHEERSQTYLYNIVSGVVLTVSLLVLWQALSSWENQRIKEVIRNEADAARSVTDQFLASEVAALERMSQRLSYQGQINQKQWERDAESYIEDMSVFQAIEWVDSSFHIRWVVPLEGNESAMNLNLASDPRRAAGFRQALQENGISVTRTVELVQGGRGFLVYSPVMQELELKGFVLGIVKVDQLMSRLIGFRDYDERFYITVSDGDEVIWKNYSTPEAESIAISQMVVLPLANVAWQAEFIPRKQFVEELVSSLPLMVLGAGGLLIFLFQGTLFFYYQAREVNRLNIRKERQLEQSNQALQQAEQRYRAITYLMPVGVLLIDRQGNIAEANEQACTIFGYRSEQLLAMNVDQLVPDMVRNKHAALREGFQGDRGARKMAGDGADLMGLTADDCLVPIEVGLSSIEIGQETYIIASITDMTERKRMLQELKVQNIQMDCAMERLRHSNEQLERFAFVCSHDLQEPVRMVLSFSQLLERRLSDNLDDKSRSYLHYITDGAQRARSMISDILTFCRLDQNVQATEEVALEDICVQVKNTLQEVMTEKQAEFSWQQPLPVLSGIPSQVFQLFLNLVGNGLKFNRSEQPRVVISAEEQGDLWLIDVQDNGIGIDEKYRDKLFTIFQRLNTKEEFPGTGIGLAICKKVAGHHGAEIDVFSEPDKGSRFRIKWPKSISGDH